MFIFNAYRRIKLHASSNWPFLWASRLDVPVLFFFINILFIFAALDLSQLAVNVLGITGLVHIRHDSVYWISLPISGVFIGVVSTIGMIYWIAVIWRTLPMKQIPRLANSPGMFTLIAGCLLPFLAALALVLKFAFDIGFYQLGETEIPGMTSNDINGFIIAIAAAALIAMLVKIARLTSIGGCFIGFLLILALVSASAAVVFFVDYFHTSVEVLIIGPYERTASEPRTTSVVAGFIVFYLPLIFLVRTFWVGKRTKLYMHLQSLILWIAPFIGVVVLILFAWILQKFGTNPAEFFGKFAQPIAGGTILGAVALFLAILLFGLICRIVAELSILPQD